MALLLNDPRFRRDAIGMPDSHAEKFKDVAAGQRCVIISRAVGPTCRQLLEQGYDTKGFRIHGKSCDWGPMAGFVLRDPRLNKYGLDKAGYNRGQHHESLTDAHAGAGWTAATVPLKIYEERRVWLVENRKIQVAQRAGAGAARWEGYAAHPSGIGFHYALVADPAAPGVWGVYLDRTKNAGKFRQEIGSAVVRYDTKYGDMYEPLLAMTNSPDHRSWPGNDFRNAVTGDYDLFAVWPYAENYQHEGDDRRVLGTAQAWSDREHIERVLERNFTVGGQGTKMGNITNRIYLVSQLLNSSIAAASTGGSGRVWGPFPNRMVCWHSDESARPFVNDVDLPVVAFAPSRLEVGIETIFDFRAFVENCLLEGIQVTLAEGWTLDPTAEKRNRLGGGYARLVPSWINPRPWRIPDWYNR